MLHSEQPGALLPLDSRSATRSIPQLRRQRLLARLIDKDPPPNLRVAIEAASEMGTSRALFPSGDQRDTSAAGCSRPGFNPHANILGRCGGWRSPRRSGMELSSARVYPRVFGPVAQPDRATVS